MNCEHCGLPEAHENTTACVRALRRRAWRLLRGRGACEPGRYALPPGYLSPADLARRWNVSRYTLTVAPWRQRIAWEKRGGLLMTTEDAISAVVAQYGRPRRRVVVPLTPEQLDALDRSLRAGRPYRALLDEMRALGAGTGQTRMAILRSAAYVEWRQRRHAGGALAGAHRPGQRREARAKVAMQRPYAWVAMPRERDALIRDEIQNGGTQVSIGARFGVTRERVRQLIARAGLTEFYHSRRATAKLARAPIPMAVRRAHAARAAAAWALASVGFPVEIIDARLPLSGVRVGGLPLRVHCAKRPSLFGGTPNSARWHTHAHETNVVHVIIARVGNLYVWVPPYPISISVLARPINERRLCWMQSCAAELYGALGPDATEACFEKRPCSSREEKNSSNSLTESGATR